MRKKQVKLNAEQRKIFAQLESYVKDRIKWIGDQDLREVASSGGWFAVFSINEDPENALSMLDENMAIRIAKKETLEPNFEIKLPKRDTDNYSLENRIKVILKSGEIYIGSLELNIAFKLFLSSEKDIEDARFLYKLFKEKINKEKLEYFIEKLNVKEAFGKYLL